MRGIKFNNKHSIKDFNIYVSELDTSPPTKNKIKESIPFMNGAYDFSELYGSNTFKERSLKYTFELLEDSPLKLNILKTQIENWLLGCGKCELYDDAIPGFYFLAECTNIDEYDDRYKSVLSVEFTAYPFKIGEHYEGNNLWDTFNFELDVLQDTKFTVNGASSVSIYNPSVIDIEPEIIASSQFEITLDNKKYVVEAGTSKDYRFKFKKGANNLTLKGNGTIEFRFRKEVL